MLDIIAIVGTVLDPAGVSFFVLRCVAQMGVLHDEMVSTWCCKRKPYGSSAVNNLNEY